MKSKLILWYANYTSIVFTDLKINDRSMNSSAQAVWRVKLLESDRIGSQPLQR